MKEVLSKGQCYYYLSIPNNCDISNIEVLDDSYNGTENLDLYYYSKNKSEIDLVCNALKSVVVDNFKDNWQPDKEEVYYWITLDNCSHFRTLHIKEGKLEENEVTYKYNIFKTEEDAKNILNRILQQLT